MSEGNRAPRMALDTIVQTKLHIPAVPHSYVARARLLVQLESAQHVRLTLITAPAGSGKTTLASSWAHQQADAVVWLGLDPTDNDPARFWSYVLHALHGLDPTGVAPLLAALRSPQPSPIEAILAALLNALAARPAPLGIVLDDYHTIETPAIHRVLTWLIDHLPSQVHLLIASRADPPLPLGRWRVRGQLCELRAHDLRFTHAEAATFLTDAMGLALGHAEVAALDDRVEGWAAGLQLAALALRGHADPVARIAVFSGRHAYVLAYLVDDVLAGQPEYVQHFLLCTAILDQMSAPLCDAVLGAVVSNASAAIPTSRFILDYLRECNLFLVPLDDEGNWFRYHHLFRDVLRHRLRQTNPAHIPELHCRAAAWFAAQGLIDAAIQHALAAGDHLLAARWIERAVDVALRSGDIAPLRGWLATLPEALVRARPQLAVGQLWLLFITGQEDLVPTWIDALAAALTAEPDGDAVRSAEDQARLRAELAALRAQQAIHMGELDEAVAQCRAGLSIAPSGALRTRGALELLQGTVIRLMGDFTAAVAHFTAARRLAEQGGEELLLLHVAESLANLAEIRGQLGAMVTEYARMRRLTVDASGQPMPLAGMALIGMGKVVRERNDLEAAAALLAEGIDIARRSAISGFAIDGLMVLALVEIAKGNQAGAAMHLQEAAALAERWHSAMVEARVAVFRARLALAAGNVKDAVRWAITTSEQPAASYSDQGEIEQLTLVRVWIAQGRTRQARTLLTRLEQSARAGLRHGRLIEILALRALVAQAVGDDATASATLAEALALGQAEGYVRVFADEGVAMGNLVRRVAAQRGGGQAFGLRADYLAAVQEACTGPQSPPVTTNEQLVEPLSVREQEVLALIAAGCSNREIADRLIISVATVRKHVENIHGKLGVQSRTQAAARAREFGLA